MSRQQMPTSEQPSKRSQIIDGIIITVAGSAIVGLLGYFVVAQKNEIIQTLRTDLNQSKSDLMAELQRERESRFRLAVALKDAGVNIPMGVLFSYAGSSNDPQASEELAESLVGTLPLLESSSEYHKVAEANALEGRDRVVCSKLSDGTGILAFANGSSPNADPLARSGMALSFNHDGESIQINEGSCSPLLDLVRDDELWVSNFYRVQSISSVAEAPGASGPVPTSTKLP